MPTVLRDDPDRDWHTPGVFEVRDGIYRIPLPMPNDGLTAVNVYALRAPDTGAVTLIDGGWNVDEAWTTLHDGLRALDVAPTDVRRVLVTHVHRDHYTLAVRLQREFGTHIALGAGEREGLAAAKDMSGQPFADRLAILERAGADPLLTEIRRLPRFHLDPDDWRDPDEWLEPTSYDADGRRLEVVDTPGHTRGHVVFVDPGADVTYTGDHILPRITPSLGLEGRPTESPLADFLVSLQKVADLPDRVMLPAHGPVSPSVRDRALELLHHHAVRLDQCAAAVAGGATTAWEVARVVRWTRREKHLDDLDLFNRILAVSETVAHLFVLVAQARLTVTSDPSGVRRYRA